MLTDASDAREPAAQRVEEANLHTQSFFFLTLEDLQLDSLRRAMQALRAELHFFSEFFNFSLIFSFFSWLAA
jgi:hypothetical protein